MPLRVAQASTCPERSRGSLCTFGVRARASPAYPEQFRGEPVEGRLAAQLALREIEGSIAEGKGSSTTSAVVMSIFLVVIVDVLFTALFYFTGA